MPEQDATIDGDITELRPTRFLEARATGDLPPTTGLIILNSPLTDYDYLERLYDHASYRLCADGGANRLHDLLTAPFPEAQWDVALRGALPDAIHGDLDSLKDVVRERYHRLGVDISLDPDQYSTDFGKGIKKVMAKMPLVRDMLVLGSIGGRVDQGIGLLHELFREQKCRHPGVRFWLFSEASVTVLLQPGKTVLHTPLKEGLIERNIGILPLFGKARISTSGLEWDVEDWPTEMGIQVSTSNHIVSDRISMTTDKEVLFTVERKVDR